MLWFVLGYVKIKINTDDIYEFTQKLKEENITLKNIRYFNKSYYADALYKDIKKIEKIARTYLIKISINERFGIKAKLAFYKNKPGLIITILVFVFLFFLNTLFIKDIEISGNTYLTDKQILSHLKDVGLEKGSFKYGFTNKEIQSKLMKTSSHFSWVWVDIKGTKLKVDVREKISVPNHYDKTKPTNIVAKTDGVIESIVSRQGTHNLKKGMYVKKGDLLINGVYDGSDYAPVRFVHADGIVMARTTYEIKDTFDSKITKYIKQGEKNTYTLNLFGFILSSGITDNKTYFKSNEKNYEFKIFGKKYFPLAFTKEKYCEIIKKEYTLDYQNAQDVAFNNLSKRLLSKLDPNVEVLNKTKTINRISDTKFEMIVRFECLEDISQHLEFEVVH